MKLLVFIMHNYCDTVQPKKLQFMIQTIFAQLLLCIACLSSSLQAVDMPAAYSKPRVSIITSVYKGDEFIEGFLADTVKQTIFSECELIIINANSPGNEEPIIKKYMALYPNIVYIRLVQDPGLYAVWNQAIRFARADFITNANIDDRSHLSHLEVHVKELEKDPGIDLVYSSLFITEIPNETFDNNHYKWYSEPAEFSPYNMRKCLPGPRPVWRKSLHDRYGFFDETFRMVGDWEMWARAASRGSLFKKIPGFYTLFYQNSDGLSTSLDAKKAQERDVEGARIYAKYHSMMDPESPPIKKKKIGLCITATGRYDQFVPNLINSARSYFCTQDSVTFFVFTDGTIPVAPDIVRIEQKRLGWPKDTMMRFEIYYNNRQALADMDYLFALDADMRFVNTVDREILSDLVGTQHPCYVGRRGTYETNTKSLAFVSPHEGTEYFAGGFWGGSKDSFLKTCDQINQRILVDLNNGIIPLWHDESHLNRYFIDYPPTLILSPEYCYPEGTTMPGTQRLVAIFKDLSKFRD